MISRPAYVAKMTGIPEIANLQHIDLPKADITIDQLVKIYKDQNPSTAKTKARCVKNFREMAKLLGARTINDLTQESLLEYKKAIEESKTVTSAGTKTWIFGQIKGMLAFGLKCGLDQKQLRTALDNCKVLWTATPAPAVNPKPISREDFHRLLEAADGGPWRAWLLMGLCLLV